MFDTILVAVDGSKPAEKAVDWPPESPRPTAMRSSSST
jgi:hypothetical protein